MMSYLIYMAIRLIEMRRLLKDTGSIYLHCDPTASHYLKLLMDCVFGPRKFLNEMAWKRSAAHNDIKQGMRRAGKVRDSLLVHTKTDEHTWNAQYTPYTNEYLESEYRHEKGGRRYKETDLTAAKPGGETEYEWRVKRPRRGKCRWVADLTKEHESPCSDWEYRGVVPYRNRYWAYSKTNMARFWLEGKLTHRETGMPRLMHFADEMPGIPLQDWWDDVSPVSGKEKTKYPTQKPLALLRRVIQASSNDGDVVLDPFCGCATACIASEIGRREWVGIDISEKAAVLVKDRMDREIGKVFSGAHRTDIPKRTDLGIVIQYNDARNKRLLYGEQGGYCHGCETHFELRNLDVDHIIPRAKGGTDHISNLQLLCGHCNSIKGDRPHEYLLACLTDKGWIKRKMAA